MINFANYVIRCDFYAKIFYLFFGILWFFIYLIIGISQDFVSQGYAFCTSTQNYISTSEIIEKPFDLLYFSFKTLTTVGYGDIYPESIAAKIFSNLEGIVGVMFPAVFIARLVGGFNKNIWYWWGLIYQIEIKD